MTEDALELGEEDSLELGGDDSLEMAEEESLDLEAEDPVEINDDPVELNDDPDLVIEEITEIENDIGEELHFGAEDQPELSANDLPAAPTENLDDSSLEDHHLTFETAAVEGDEDASYSDDFMAKLAEIDEIMAVEEDISFSELSTEEDMFTALEDSKSQINEIDEVTQIASED